MITLAAPEKLSLPLVVIRKLIYLAMKKYRHEMQGC